MFAPLCDLHTHTNLCDGADSPEEMAAAAASCGLSVLGFSGHSPTHFGCDWALSDTEEYRRRINSLKGSVPGLTVLCGLEADREAAAFRRDDYDYIIGSVHYLPLPGGGFSPVDESAELQRSAIRDRFGGSAEAYALAYFEAVADMAERLRPDILGHLDLLCKFNVGGCIFDETSAAYTDAALAALDAAIDRGIIVELNMGGLLRARGGRADIRPAEYPSDRLLRHMLQRGVSPILSSDAHRRDHLSGLFSEGAAQLRRLGFRSRVIHDGRNFTEVGL